MNTSPLQDREQRILDFIVEEFIRSGEPVASGRIASATVVSVSSATIRNVMSSLEERGYLTQPHTSAGRIPTHKGLRAYVDVLEPMEFAQPHELSGRDVSETVKNISGFLSTNSTLTGLVLGPSLHRIRLKDVRILPVSGRRLVAVLVTDDGRVIDRVIRFEETIDAVTFTRMQNYLTHLVSGCTLPELRARVSRELMEARHRYTEYVLHALALGDAIVSEQPPTQLTIDGALNVFDFVGSDIQRMRDLLEVLEEKKALVDLLDRIQSSASPTVYIGTELEWDLGQELSLVVCGYDQCGAHVGLVGILGPLRMDYRRMIGLVDSTARVLSKELEDRAT